MRVRPFIGTDAAGAAYDRAMAREPRWWAYFTNGERWEFSARDMTSAQNDARFWAEFTGRELQAVAGL